MPRVYSSDFGIPTLRERPQSPASWFAFRWRVRNHPRALTNSSSQEIFSNSRSPWSIDQVSLLRALWQHAALFLALIASAFLAIRLISLHPTNLTAIWLPSGIALVALLVAPGLSAIPTIWLANWAIVAAENHYPLLSWQPYSFLLAAVNTAGPLLGWWIWRRWLKLAPFSDGWHYLKFVFGVALAPALLTSWMVVAIVRAAGYMHESSLEQLIVRAGIITISDALGVFLVVPLVLSPRDSGLLRSSGKRLLADLTIVVLALAACWIGFTRAPFLLWLAVPLALVSAIASGPRGVAALVLTFAAYGLVATEHGLGPFALGNSLPFFPLLRMGAFAFSLGITGQFAGIVLDQLRRHQQHLEELVAVRTAALAKAKEGAEAADRAKSLFLATMSHEIRTPMNGVLGFARMLEAGHLNPDQREYVESILSSGAMLLTLLNDILDLSKIEAGAMQIERKPVDLRRVARNVARLFASAAERKNLRLDCVVDESVPARVYGDTIRITQVLTNLVSNSVKFTDQGSVEVRISAQTAAAPDGTPGQEIVFRVRDTGIGITDAEMARLFRSFSQADSSTTRRFGGTGLGLVITRRLCGLMGGSLDAESKSNKGSTFTARIRTDVAPEEAAAEGAPDSQRPGGAASGGPLDVLLVEDNPLNRRLGQAMLGRLGHRTAFASNGREALERIQDRRFDVVLMDVQMPEMDGLTATRLIRERESRDGNRRLPIIAVTADAMIDDRKRCLLAGMDDYLMKPLDLDLLSNALLKAANHPHSSLSQDAGADAPERGSPSV